MHLGPACGGRKEGSECHGQGEELRLKKLLAARRFIPSTYGVLQSFLRRPRRASILNEQCAGCEEEGHHLVSCVLNVSLRDYRDSCIRFLLLFFFLRFLLHWGLCPIDCAEGRRIYLIALIFFAFSGQRGVCIKSRARRARVRWCKRTQELQGSVASHGCMSRDLSQ